MNLEGRIIVFLGDSITEGHDVVDIKNNRYDNIIKRKCKLKEVHNYGIGGTRLAHQAEPSEKPKYDLCFCGRAYRLNSDADIIVVYGGTNDYGHGDAMFGEMTDSTPKTFCGAVDFLMRLLLETYPDSQIVFMTPARREGDLVASTDARKANADGRPLKEYVDVIIKKGEQYNVPVLNLYDNLGINPNNMADREKYTSDGLHYIDEGQEVIADRLIEFLQSL